MASSGVNGLSVGVVTVGGLMIYAGIRGVTPLQALRDVSSGRPPRLPDGPTVVTTGGNVAQLGQGASASVLVAAKSIYAGDKYSRLRRTDNGFSDCSSFVDKAYHAAGVALPDGRMAWPNTTAFATAPAWTTISLAQTEPGDIAVVSGKHMVMITAPGGTEAIGQQNKQTNVKTGSLDTLFAGVRGTIIYRTYTGEGSTGSVLATPAYDEGQRGARK